MEVLIYIAGALVTFAVIWVVVDCKDMGTFERAWLIFGFAGVWPIIWMLFITAAVMGLIEYLTGSKTVLQCKHGNQTHHPNRRPHGHP